MIVGHVKNIGSLVCSWYTILGTNVKVRCVCHHSVPGVLLEEHCYSFLLVSYLAYCSAFKVELIYSFYFPWAIQRCKPGDHSLSAVAAWGSVMNSTAESDVGFDASCCMVPKVNDGSLYGSLHCFHKGLAVTLRREADVRGLFWRTGNCSPCIIWVY